MAEWYKNIMCVTVMDLTGGETPIMSYAACVEYLKKYPSVRFRRACRHTPALLAYDLLRSDIKAKYVAMYGNPYQVKPLNQLEKWIKPDVEAFGFFSRHKLPDGSRLKPETQREYAWNAGILKSIGKLAADNMARRKASKTKMWEDIAELITQLDTDEYPHSLPTSGRKLHDKYKTFLIEGYTSLIHKGFGNVNSRVVNKAIERLVLSLYCHKNKPYITTVLDQYLQFLGGSFDIIDVETGEIFNRLDFYKASGAPITISEGTVSNIVNDPKNRALVDKFRNDTLTHRNIHEPHHHRHAPNFALSKISMDDRDLPRKMPNGNRVKAYYAYDVKSGACIGAAYSQSKDSALFINCMRDMFRFLDREGFGVPLEVEVEHHLVNNFKNDLMKAGIVFPFVRWCNAGNSQEKYAETGNRKKKYGFEKRYQQGIGRFYAKLEANNTKSEKIFDADNNNYKEPTYSFETLVADDLEIIQKYNNSLHKNQKRYQGMTLLQILRKYASPDLANVDRPLLTRYIGEKTDTSIRRNQYCQVQYAKYGLPSPEYVGMLAPNNYEVQAYWLPNEDGEIERVYLYQGEEFICEAAKIVEYNSATAEWIDKDEAAYSEQSKYVNQFRTMLKTERAKITPLQVVEQRAYYQDEPAEVVVHKAIHPPEEEDEFARLVNEYNNGQTRLKAIQNL